MIKSFILFVAFSISFVLCQGQSLSVDETISYLNKLSRDFPQDGRFYYDITISNDGFINIVCWVNDKESNRNSLNYTQKFHHSTIDFQRTFAGDLGGVSIPCKNNESCVTGAPGKYSNHPGPGRNGARFGSSDSYSQKKMINAWIYLLSLLSESKGYQRDDTDDPFNPVNFNAKNSITGGSTIIKIPLSEENGVFAIYATLGNTRLKFIFDSGASETSISSEVERQLIDNKVITKSNYLTPGLYRIADGSIITARRVKIPKLKIGDYTVSNISVSISGTGSPLLLGRNVLDRFKKWSVDNGAQHLTLEKY
jgi:clan AA aspartic protease (TIGR02281 family)